MDTYKFKLCSGLMCEITEMTGKHFRILTKKTKGETHSTRLNRMLADLIVQVGGVKVSAQNAEARLEFVGELLANDRKHILVEARQFSMDFAPNFTFKYTYEFEGKEVEDTMVINLEKSPKNDLGHFPVTPNPKQFGTMYTKKDKEIEVELPRSKKRVKYYMLDGNGENIGSRTKDPTASVIFKMRRTQYFNPNAGKEGVWMSLDPETLGMKDWGFLFNKFKANEGSVDTEMRLIHPKADELGLEGENRYLIVNLLDLEGFFFPEG